MHLLSCAKNSLASGDIMCRVRSGDGHNGKRPSKKAAVKVIPHSRLDFPKKLVHTTEVSV